MATAVIASKFGPEEFGFYQLALAYVAIFDVLTVLSPTHLRNHLVANPSDEAKVIHAWVWVNSVLWIVLVLYMGLMWLIGDNRSFYILLFYSSLRLIFRIFEYPQILMDARLRSDLTQKTQIVSSGIFNIFRAVFAVVSGSINTVAAASFFQGVGTSIYQLWVSKKIKLSLKGEKQSGFAWNLIKQGFPLAVMSFLVAAQGRIFGILLPSRMGLEDYGSLQLVLKLIEPVTSLGTIIISANYTLLARTYGEDRKSFLKRFLKVSTLTLASSLLMSVVLVFFPQNWLIRIFGAGYASGIENLWIGPIIILSNVIFSLSIQFDMLTYSYSQTLWKCGVAIVGYVVLILTSDSLAIVDALWMNAAIPLLTSLICLPVRRLRGLW